MSENTDYANLATRKILEDILTRSGQLDLNLDLFGRLLALEKDKETIRFIEISTLSEYPELVNLEISLTINLQRRFRDKDSLVQYLANNSINLAGDPRFTTSRSPTLRTYKRGRGEKVEVTESYIFDSPANGFIVDFTYCYSIKL